MQHVVAEGDSLGREAAAHLAGAPPELLLAVADPGEIALAVVGVLHAGGERGEAQHAQ